ncbi:hypothetical protein, partial [Streptomyces sp. AC627_RSS907]|uniref:hypothetical protein n=1 Tax=Streptomyces sp. AC627_RSS907 TaxID=2823684 RepID=UPI001C26B4D7
PRHKDGGVPVWCGVLGTGVYGGYFGATAPGTAGRKKAGRCADITPSGKCFARFSRSISCRRDSRFRLSENVFSPVGIRALNSAMRTVNDLDVP